MAQGSTARAWSRGGLVFAATMLLMVGVFQIFQGIAAIIQDQFFVVGQNYAYTIDTTAWGWIHLGLGIMMGLAGFFLFTGKTWARVVGIAVASLSAIANFTFLPYYPLWALVIIALDVFVIWALATVKLELTDEEMAEARADVGMGMPTSTAQAMANNPPSDRWATDQARDLAGAPNLQAPTGTGMPTTAPAGAPSGMPPSEMPNRPPQPMP
jgi:hypothetical protein